MAFMIATPALIVPGISIDSSQATVLVALLAAFLTFVGIAKLFVAVEAGRGPGMLIPSSMPRLKGFRFPRAIIAYAVWGLPSLCAQHGRCPRTCWRSVASSSVVRQSAFGSTGLVRILPLVSAVIVRARTTSGTWMRL